MPEHVLKSPFLPCFRCKGQGVLRHQNYPDGVVCMRAVCVKCGYFIEDTFNNGLDWLTHVWNGGRAMEFSEAQNNQTVYIQAGEPFTVKLRENPTTGYTWKLQPEDAGKLVSEKFVPDSPAKGSPGTHTWTFMPSKVGMSSIQMSSDRAWEGVSIKEFTLNVHVNPHS